MEVTLKNIKENIQVASTEIKAAATLHKEWREIRADIKEQWRRLLLKTHTEDDMPHLSSESERSSMHTAKTNAFNAIERPGDPAEPLEKTLNAMEKSFKSISRQLPTIISAEGVEPDTVIITA